MIMMNRNKEILQSCEKYEQSEKYLEKVYETAPTSKCIIIYCVLGTLIYIKSNFYKTLFILQNHHANYYYYY